MTLESARRYLAEGHFARGSMYPKIEAAIDFVHNGGPRAIITDPANITRALHGETGTRSHVPGGVRLTGRPGPASKVLAMRSAGDSR